MMFYVVVTLLAACDLIFWWWADRRIRTLKPATLWRGLVALLVLSQCAFMLFWVAVPWTMGRMGERVWIPMSSWIYLWHLLILPFTMLILFVVWIASTAAGALARLTARAPRGQQSTTDALPLPPAAPDPSPAGPVQTRRHVLGAFAAFVPKAALAGGLFASYQQAGVFRIRPMDIRLPQLPPALDGVTIAHLSDTHIGRFVRRPQLERMVASTLELKPDLIVFTGDLIDFNLSDLPMAIDAMRELGAAAPTAMCVGNHDLFEDANEFRRRVRGAGLPLLCDESLSFTVRGERIDFLGLDWGSPRSPRTSFIEPHMEQLLRRYLGGGGFPILLAHHPHAFDLAAQAGIPLTLAGHTHGGQIMLTPQIGAGNVFRYWSGLYDKGDHRLVVSNGVGNWFPLRVNAPAEIVRITLKRA